MISQIQKIPFSTRITTLHKRKNELDIGNQRSSICTYQNCNKN
uniref:Uncharacterized protein n=1 Tax=Rhizophora mucronata TaxID=61149 RepID=A0A2P2QQN7_RHIMU